MPLNLRDIITGEATGPDVAGAIPTLREEGTRPAGLEKIGGVLVAMAIKLLEIVLPLYGSDSEEGKRINRAVKAVTPLTKGIRAEDIVSLIQVLQRVMAGQMPTLSPATMAEITAVAGRGGAGPAGVPLGAGAGTTPASTPAGANLRELLNL